MFKILPLSIISLSALILALSACVHEPEGPAERIGKSLDQLSKGMQDLGNSWDNTNERDEWRRNNPRDSYKSDWERERDERAREEYRRRNPNDFKYDDSDYQDRRDDYRSY